MAALLGGLALAACDGTGPAGPGGGPASLAVVASVPTEGTDAAASVGDVFLETDSLDLRLLRLSDEATVVDRTLPFGPSGGSTAVAVDVQLDGTEATFLLSLGLRSGPDLLFRGSTDVTLRAGRTSEAEVALEPVVAGLLASPDSVRFTSLRDTVQAGAAGLFATGDTIPDVAPFWSSTDLQVVEALADGRLVSVGEGRAHAVAALSGFADSVEVVVDPVVASVRVTPSSHDFTALDESRDFDAIVSDANGQPVAGVTPVWSSTNVEVLSVDDQGVAVALANGVARVVASAAGFADSADVVIEQQPAFLDVVPDSALVTVGQTQDLEAAIEDANGNPVFGADVSWVSRDASVATVDATGTVTGQSSGVTYVVASAGGVSDSAQIVVPLVIGAAPARGSVGGGVERRARTAPATARSAR